MDSRIVVMLLLVAGACASAQAADLYVALNGKDTNSGTARKPFASIGRARDEVRQRIASGLRKDVVVQIRGGTYTLEDTLCFTPEDGTDKHSVTYQAAAGERVVLSGGRRITGWKRGDGEVWTVKLSDVAAGKWYFRQLFVNGNRATRARTPNADGQPNCWMIKSASASPSGGDADQATFTIGVDHPIQAWQNAGDVELVWVSNNDASRRRVGSIDESQQTFTLPPPHQWAPSVLPGEYQIGGPTPGRSCYLENALKMLDEPGEWYLDRKTGILHYWPRPGEDMSRAEIVAPVVQRTLVLVRGSENRPVRNLHFKGIRLGYVDRPLQPYGYTAMFGCLEWTNGRVPEPSIKWHWMEAALDFEYAQSCSFTDGAVEHCGGMGIALLRGTSAVTIEGNDIGDLGGGGVVGGGIRNRDTYKWADPIAEGEFTNLRITNNHIHDCGMVYAGSLGIFMALARHAVIAHNLIHDIAYTGISLGGNEVKSMPYAQDNVVEYNHIHHVMKTAVDGAGVYITFSQSGAGSAIRGNLIHDIPTVGCNGIYLDAVRPGMGTENYQFEDNFIFETSCPRALVQCDGSGNVWLGNSFDLGPIHSLELLRALEAMAGLDPKHYRLLMGTEKPVGRFYRLAGSNAVTDGWQAWQYDWPKSHEGVVRVFRGPEGKETSCAIKLKGLDAGAIYQVKIAAAQSALVAGITYQVKIECSEDSAEHSGRDLMEQGFPVTLPKPGQAETITYRLTRSQ